MNTQEYISSGVLEAYALGALNETERAEVEANIAQYPEIAAELLAVQQALQLDAAASPVAPPAFMKEKIWTAIQQQNHSDKTETSFTSKTVPFPGTKRFDLQRAAIWLLLIGSVLFNIVLWGNMKKTVSDKLVLSSELDSLKAEKNNLAAIIANYDREKQMVADPSMQTIVMQSTSPEHPMAATVYASKQNGDTYISIQNLPMPPQGMQYQLWVIKDGKPVDMGVLPNALVSNNGLQKISKQMTGAQAYAISLEKEGGSPVPTMDKIYVMGKVAS